MFKVKLLSLILFAAALQSHAAAYFVATDWKNAGDGLATLDTSTGLEWLDLTQTKGKTIAQVQSQLPTLYAGWRLPTHDEVSTLLANMLGEHFQLVNKNTREEIRGLTGPRLAITEFYTLLGRTNIYHCCGGLYRYWSLGYHANENGVTVISGADHNLGSGGHIMWAVNSLTSYSQYTPSLLGVYLVSDGGVTLSSINDPQINGNNPNSPINQGNGGLNDVPAPAGLFAMFSFFAISLFQRRRKIQY